MPEAIGATSKNWSGQITYMTWAESFIVISNSGNAHRLRLRSESGRAHRGPGMSTVPFSQDRVGADLCTTIAT